MKRKIVTFLALAFVSTVSSVLAQANGGSTTNEQTGSLTFAIIALSIILCSYGVYLSRKRKIVIFANYTDIAVTASIPFIAWIFIELLDRQITNDHVFIYLALLPAFCVFLIMCWATFLYNTSVNSGIFGFLLALYTKLFLFSVFCLLLFGFFFSSREKGQTRASYKKENKAYLAGAAGLLTYLGTSDRRFISLRDYCSGKWGDTQE